MMDNLLYFILLALLAEVLGTVGGFGSSLFFVPIAGFFLDFHSVLGVTAVFHLASNITKIAMFKKGFDKVMIIKMGIPAVLFVIAGAFLTKYIDSKLLEISLAIFLIALSSFLIIFRNFKIEPTSFNAISGGITSGFVAGLLGTGGAIRGLVLAAFNMRMEVFIVTSAIIDLAIDASRGVIYFVNGYVHKDDLYLIPILLVVSIIGTFIGKKILEKISETQFKFIVLGLILVTGMVTLVKFLFFS